MDGSALHPYETVAHDDDAAAPSTAADRGSSFYHLPHRRDPAEQYTADGYTGHNLMFAYALDELDKKEGGWRRGGTASMAAARPLRELPHRRSSTNGRREAAAETEAEILLSVEMEELPPAAHELSLLSTGRHPYEAPLDAYSKRPPQPASRTSSEGEEEDDESSSSASSSLHRAGDGRRRGLRTPRRGRGGGGRTTSAVRGSGATRQKGAVRGRRGTQGGGRRLQPQQQGGRRRRRSVKKEG
eukprot:Rhum_TRINITY_DN10850_c0_g1::Rhum_TRINITY_DN10850_c0_g1_i1::g.40728::m.40728